MIRTMVYDRNSGQSNIGDETLLYQSDIVILEAQLFMLTGSILNRKLEMLSNLVWLDEDMGCRRHLQNS